MLTSRGKDAVEFTGTMEEVQRFLFRTLRGKLRRRIDTDLIKSLQLDNKGAASCAASCAANSAVQAYLWAVVQYYGGELVENSPEAHRAFGSKTLHGAFFDLVRFPATGRIDVLKLKASTCRDAE